MNWPDIIWNKVKLIGLYYGQNSNSNLQTCHGHRKHHAHKIFVYVSLAHFLYKVQLLWHMDTLTYEWMQFLLKMTFILAQFSAKNKKSDILPFLKLIGRTSMN